ncbi:unnamed protein product, partial [Meganyctiphanes norvegica]
GLFPKPINLGGHVQEEDPQPRAYQPQNLGHNLFGGGQGVTDNSIKGGITHNRGSGFHNQQQFNQGFGQGVLRQEGVFNQQRPTQNYPQVRVQGPEEPVPVDLIELTKPQKNKQNSFAGAGVPRSSQQSEIQRGNDDVIHSASPQQSGFQSSYGINGSPSSQQSQFQNSNGGLGAPRSSQFNQQQYGGSHQGSSNTNGFRSSQSNANRASKAKVEEDTSSIQ